MPTSADVKKLADLLEGRASLLRHYTYHRVSHTTACLIRCVLAIKDLCRVVQSDNNYEQLLKKSFDYAHDAKGGSSEITVYDDGTIWIQGSFHLDKLRDVLLTVPQPVTIHMERANG